MLNMIGISQNVICFTTVFLAVSSVSYAESATTAYSEVGIPAALTVDQGWDNSDRAFFYFSPQGSPILPLDIFKALEQPKSDAMFLNEEYLQNFGMIFWNDAVANPEGLPIGLTVDQSRLDPAPYLGMNCSACHVTEVKVADKRALIDGGVSHFDFWRFMQELSASLTATYEDDQKFERYAARIELGSGLTKEPDRIRANLRQAMQNREDWAYRNHTSIVPGPGRVDALNVILNQVTSEMLGKPENARAPDAPVSYPFLWDAPYLDFVQYNGVVPNAGVGALARNVGQVLGVFGEVDLAERTLPLGYNSSVNVPHLIDLERKLETLKSPVWDEFTVNGLLPKVDQLLAAEGADLYRVNCASCHLAIDREDRGDLASINIQKFSLSEIGTDPSAALSFAAREVVTGPLEGRRVGVVLGDEFCEITHGNAVLAHVDTGVILSELGSDKSFVEAAAKEVIESSIHSKLGHLARGIKTAFGFSVEDDKKPDYSSIITSLQEKGMTEDEISDELSAMSDDKTALFDELVKDQIDFHGVDQTCMTVLETAQYRSRPLNGVWATGPFLHNGSVPTLRDLLNQPADRPSTFLVGDGNFDPKSIGFSPDVGGNNFMFDTSKNGNSNQGHTYGIELSEDDKDALLEYLKTL